RHCTGNHVYAPRLAALPLVFRLADRLCLLHPLLGPAVAHDYVSLTLPGARRIPHFAGRLPACGRIDYLRAVCSSGGDGSLVSSPSSAPWRYPEQLSMSVSVREATQPDPRRYFDHIAAERGPVAEVEPVCLYLETTNRCNLLCTTCPRTFEALEPPADMGWELFTHIVDQFPRIARVVLHGVGEPMMVPTLPRMIRYLK